MPATTEEIDEDLLEPPCAISRHAAWEEDSYWRRTFWQEWYCRLDLDYEDYAPAYCVGYSGCAQYGGDFDDAQRSLCANWERIKCDSRLSLAEALPAIRAAWDRMARLSKRSDTVPANACLYDQPMPHTQPHSAFSHSPAAAMW